MIWGVDFGAKLSGNTAVASYDGEKVKLYQAERSQDAGKWLDRLYSEMVPALIGIDAPLSLPPGYFHPGQDLHFRKADRLLGAMSPMFIGGLTARAIEWSQGVEAKRIEVYPSALADLLHPAGRKLRKSESDWFHKEVLIPTFIDLEEQELSIEIPRTIHQLDALLALLTALRYRSGKAISYGIESEGMIWV